LLFVESLDEAVKLPELPALNYGAIRVRPVAPECTMKQILGQKEEELAQASA
jgi:hypothetical protein